MNSGFCFLWMLSSVVEEKKRNRIVQSYEFCSSGLPKIKIPDSSDISGPK